MRSLLSRLAFGWAAIAVGLCLVLPAPQASWVAALAVAAAALSLAMGRNAIGHDAASGDDPSTGEADLLNTMAMLVRGAAHSNHLSEALHSAARILFQELGADGLITGRLDGAGAPLQLERFADPADRGAATARGSMSEVAAEAVGEHRVAGDLQRGFAVPVLRAGRSVAWLEFKSVDTSTPSPSLLRLLDLLRVELSAVAERSVWHVGVRQVVQDEIVPWRDRDAANAPTLSPGDVSLPGAARPVLVRYPQRRGAGCAAAVLESPEVLDHSAVERLRELDPSGANRLFERLVTAFEASAMRLIPQLRNHALSGDVDGLRQLASTLRAASASIGALTLARLCGEMEGWPGADGGPELTGRVDSMVGEIDLVLSVLRSLPAHRT